MEATVKERLINYLKFKNISQKRFADTTGLSSGYVNAIKKSIQPDTLHRISMYFPDLNTGWLITGEGAMLKESTINNSSNVIINKNVKNSGNIDNRQYYSDSPDVLRAQIELLDERLTEKDAQIKEKDAQINSLLSILGNSVKK